MFTTGKRIPVVEIVAVALCIYFAIDAPAYAHDCVGRMQNARSIADLVSQSTMEDCIRTGYFQALITAIAGIVAGGAIVVAVQRALSAPPPNWMDGWDIKDPDAFCKLGKRIKELEGFQQQNSQGRAGYVFRCMQQVASSHNLRAGNGWPLDEYQIGTYRGQSGIFWSAIAGTAAVGVGLGAVTTRTLVGSLVGGVGGAVVGAIGAYFAKPPPAGPDNESCASIKFGKLGNCGEYAVAMRKAMECAGVNASIVAADDSPKKEFSDYHGGTYTSVITAEPNDAGMLQHPEKWTVYDLYEQLRDKEKKIWSDIGTEGWMNNFDKSKKFIKDFSGHNVKAWRCDGCGTINGFTAGVCRKCGIQSPLPPEQQSTRRQ
jgi:hypothetical protein